MKFMMIFEGVDRATKVMNKVMSAEKKAAASAKAGAKASQSAADAATKATQRQSSALAKIGSVARGAYSVVVAGAKSAAKATVDLHNKTIALVKAGFANIAGGAKKAFRGVALASAVAVSAFGASAAAASQLVGTAAQFEKFQTILETTEGSSEKARAAMAWVSDFAVSTPYELDQVMDSFVKLRAYGLDPTNGLLRDLGDTSAAMGKPLEAAVEAIADAVTGENERLKEFGIKAAVQGNEIFYAYTVNGQKKIAKALANDPGGIQAALTGIMQERYSGAMDKLSRTWEGMVSNLADVWNQFKLAIMNAGLFDWMKGRLEEVLAFVSEMKASGTLDAWAKNISDNIVFVLEGAWQFGTRLWQIMETLGGYLKMAADYVGGWENLALVLAGLAFAPILVSTAAGLVQIAIGLSMLSAALMANPIVLLIAAIVAGAVAIYMNWEPIKAFFLDLWSSIASAASAAWAVVAEWLGFDPLAALSSAWSSVASTIANVWASLPSLEWSGLVPALSWNNILTVLTWTSWLSPLRWLDFIPGFSWAGIISTVLDWGAYILQLDWSAFLPAFSWSGVLSVVSWATWLSPLRWLDFIPGFSWAGIISGALDWGAYILRLDWSAFLPAFSWSGALSVLSWATWLSPLRWLDFIPSFSWPTLPAFRWPDLPALELPQLPDIAGYISAFGDTAMGAIDAVASRLGNAWARVKSAFSFGEQTADLSVTDPATIRAAAEATAGLRADMQAVAAIDTSASMNGLAALQRSAGDVLTAVMSSIQRAQTFIGSVSFYSQGAALMDTMAAGIRARAAVAVAEIAKVAQMMRDHLPSSPAKVGPLSDIHRLKFGETIASSIRAKPMVKAMRAAAAATMGAAAISAPAIAADNADPRADQATVARAAVARLQVAAQPASQPAQDGRPIVYSPNITMPAGTSAADKEAFSQLLREHSRELAQLIQEEDRRESRRKP